MEISSVELYLIRIPFRWAFEHASARRAFSENILVRCRSKDGHEGWGESIARDYVTGDTTDGVMATCLAISPSAWKRTFLTATEVRGFCIEAGLAGKNVARCAVEMALLDCLARSRSLRLDELLERDLPDLVKARNSPPFRYAGPLGLGSPFKTFISSLKIKTFGFQGVKIKMSLNMAGDATRLMIARRILGSRMDLRADANESWTLEHALEMAPILKRHRVSAVEQPFHKSNKRDSELFQKQTGIPLVFDESLCSEADALELAERRLSTLFAVKLAKLGGFISTLEVLAIASAHGIPVQISCQVGESAILSAAGRRLAAICPNLRHLEGSYDRFLLAATVAREEISVEWGGNGRHLRGPGLGIEVDPDKVEQLTIQKHSLHTG